MTAPYLGQIFDADTVDVTLGTTQYLIVRLAPDGSRRAIDAVRVDLGSSTPTWEVARDLWLGRWNNDPAMFWGEYDSFFRDRIRAGAGNQFMPYPPADGIPVEPVDDPVNQIPYLQRYQGNAAVSAHDLQVTLGNDVMDSATADDYHTVKHTFFHLIGAAWLRYVEWAAVDPEEIIMGGNYDGTPLWKRNLDEHAGTDAALCGTCDVANFARRFYFHADLPLFRRLNRSGIVYSVDRSANPWSATIFAVATQPQSQYYDDLDTAYHEALRYYDENVGAALHQA